MGDVLERITPRTKAVMIVHIYGLPVNLEAYGLPVNLGAVEMPEGIKVIEDAAEAHGQTCSGFKCGTLGNLSCFSFYANKIVTTGEGGMVLTDDDELAEKCRNLRNLCHGPRFHHERLGWNYRMSNLQAAVGCAQLERIEWAIAKKRMIGGWYNSLLANLPVRLPIFETSYAKNLYWVYPIVCQRPAKEIIDAMREKGVECRPFFKPLHLQPMIRNTDTYPVAEHAWKYGLYLPSGLALTLDEARQVAETLREVL
jgi:perosamine synthetase